MNGDQKKKEMQKIFDDRIQSLYGLKCCAASTTEASCPADWISFLQSATSVTAPECDRTETVFAGRSINSDRNFQTFRPNVERYPAFFNSPSLEGQNYLSDLVTIQWPPRNIHTCCFLNYLKETFTVFTDLATRSTTTEQIQKKSRLFDEHAELLNLPSIITSVKLPGDKTGSHAGLITGDAWHESISFVLDNMAGVNEPASLLFYKVQHESGRLFTKRFAN